MCGVGAEYGRQRVSLPASLLMIRVGEGRPSAHFNLSSATSRIALTCAAAPDNQGHARRDRRAGPQSVKRRRPPPPQVCTADTTSDDALSCSSGSSIIMHRKRGGEREAPALAWAGRRMVWHRFSYRILSPSVRSRPKAVGRCVIGLSLQTGFCRSWSA
ncbi:hypothetical protein D3C87_1662350 [compost metagenome]